jgi:UDPglucose 6-dehydrogenase
MKIGIAGYGFVGKAQELILKDYNDILISDPQQGYYEDLKHADAIIICVSTPEDDNGACDMSNVFDVLESAPNVPILIKSTISLSGWQGIQNCYVVGVGNVLEITFSPEFLRAAHWETDARLQDHIYLGGGNTGYWADLFIGALGNISVSVAEPQELITAKAVRNSFLATKVAFFNEVYDYCQANNIDYESVADVVGADSRITRSHTQITDERGFGGHCFPKDTKAFTTSAKQQGVELSILNAAIQYNKNLRKDNI